MHFLQFLAVECTLDPVAPLGGARGEYDFLSNGGNHSYTSNVTYWCPEPGWGFPSSGESETVSTCMETKEWSVTAVEECVCEFKMLFKVKMIEEYLVI